MGLAFAEGIALAAVVAVALAPALAVRAALYVVANGRKSKLLGLLESTPRLAATPAAEAVAYKYGLFRTPTLARPLTGLPSLADVLAIGTFVLVTGACSGLIALMVLHPDALQRPMVLLSGEGLRMANFYSQTFAVAYLWSLFHLLKHLRRFSLSPLTFLEATLHVVVALLIAFIVGPFVVTADSLGLTATIVAVAAGLHEVLIAAGRPKLLTAFGQRGSSDSSPQSKIEIVPSSKAEIGLSALEGISETVIGDLARCDIDNVHALATANPFLLYVETRFSLLQILDWVGQAQLAIVVGADKFHELRSLSIRTSLDLVRRGQAQLDMLPLPKQTVDAALQAVYVERLNYIYSVTSSIFHQRHKPVCMQQKNRTKA